MGWEEGCAKNKERHSACKWTKDKGCICNLYDEEGSREMERLNEAE